MTAKRICSVFLFVALLAPTVLFAQGVLSFPDPSPAPGFTLSTVDGTPVSLTKLRGRPVLLAFWQTT